MRTHARKRRVTFRVPLGLLLVFGATSGVKRGQANSEQVRVNAGLTRQALAAKPANFAPDIRH